ncbi:MAG: 4-alpha-glucanotransferase [Pyrinomonadaceae bacterium]
MFQRGSGILLHITSLPSGDLGASAYSFVDKLAEAGQHYWQILPVNQTGYGDSPYGCLSAFAGNVKLITSEDLHAEFEEFKVTDDRELAEDFHRFCDTNWFWLDDYSLYISLREANDYKAWNKWDEPLQTREPDAIRRARTEHDAAIFEEKFRQFTFYRQWNELKSYANEKGVSIIGDIPIYVAFDSADVWCNQSKFKLNTDGSPKFVAGVPPDFFSSTGQLWGNPVYDWDAMRADGFAWWVERVHQNLRLFDIARIDHFIGLTRAYEVPGNHTTAEYGEWMSVPGTELFNKLRQDIGELPLIAEDLGEVTKEVEQLRDSFGIAGMRVLQFAFGGDAHNTHLPHNHVPHSAVYTGTHDNDTAIGWYKAGSKPRKQQHIKHCLKYLKSNAKEINWDMIAGAFASVGVIAIAQMQDVLGLDNSARMNTPATLDNNWSWRMTEDQLETADFKRLREISEFYGR